MNERRSLSVRALAVLRWSAIIIGILLVVIVIVLNVAGAAGGQRQPIELTDVVQLVGMLVVWIGALLAWKYPLPGAGMLIGGYLFFEAVTYVKTGHFAGRWFLLFPALGIMHIVYWWQKRSRDSRITDSP